MRHALFAGHPEQRADPAGDRGTAVTTRDAAAVGSLARDRRRDRVGVVMARYAGEVYLRPLGGGVEWTARAEDLLPADRRDELRARVGELNANSRDSRCR
ncbi:hypothetical protein [Streptacidiphilus sp. P02-A3a]|uniref:hypothetical protein n=1 Tax=Streptacidiphilus sp. P02-A3a TaxID=2704468 RepID=UPI0015F7FE18|nr:hypothetical protein [Streptacidiphilus sp. P02-A3a]QMU68145.1 hypothetical protein GXP74_07830 [Streptacidiphilus sp. P02-A3a]